ncbi:MAG TPA: hypothetical protein VMT51_13080 [Dongiaceae bacterium]|nr:hypothetical protein [Dongiaceae bacterium]
MKASVQLPKKKEYQAPKLLKYGDLTEMTAAHLTTRGKKDGGAITRKTG